MLLRLILQNFLSFYGPTQFDMFPNPKRERFINHIYQSDKVPLLKQAAIYGANGAGKSNVIKALSFLKGFTTRMNYYDLVDFNDYRFQLVENNSKPVSLTIEFKQEKYYIYQVEIFARKINEKLWLSSLGDGENKLLFERTGTKLSGENVGDSMATEALLKKNQRSSIIALNEQFPVILSKDVTNVYKWFKDTLITVSINFQINRLIDMLSKKPQMLSFASSILSDLQISDALKVSELDFNQWLNTKHGKDYKRTFSTDPFADKSDGYLSATRNGRNEFNIVKKNGEQIVQEFLFEQTGLNGYRKDMDIDSQSDGSVRLLTLIPLLFDAMYNKKIVVIDEIENSMHPTLIYKLIKFFSVGESNGQLIFTTHLTKFMNQQDLMRLDELWTVEKINGASHLRSLNDFNIHNTINVENGYLEGRYGGLPVIGVIGDEEN